ncbi:MAG TPA: tRNA lysidine(34) synthetase TilS [Ignavibacteriaceae bacterium]|nr:tRNA lysidine(34) synthetase TilS [Ignavibacteriaceae bacterium]
MDKIEQKFLKFIDEQFLISPGEKIIVAFSGGPDSVFLLHLLDKYKRRIKVEIFAIHVNHLLRGSEADEDERFCQEFCAQRRIKFYSVKKRVRSFAERNKISHEEAGRILRYKEFERVLKQNKANKIATAHNANDNTETVLLNLIKGTGLDGISGIPVQRDNIIRPILSITKEEILSYLQRNEISFQIDRTNEESDYERNYLRNKIIPLIKQKLNPSLDTAILNSSDNFKKIKDYILKNEHQSFQKIEKKSPGILKIYIEEFKKEDETLRNLLLKNLLERELEQPVFSDDIKKVNTMIDAQAGRRVELTGGNIVFRERGYLKFISTQNSDEDKLIRIKVGESKYTPAGNLSIKKYDKESLVYSINKNKEYISADNASEEFIVRRWKPGDSFIPLGMKGSKKISDFLNEQKVESSGKKKHLILVNENQVVWVIGLRIDERFKITPSTKKILELCLN